MFNPQVSALKYANRNPLSYFKFQVSSFRVPPFAFQSPAAGRQTISNSTFRISNSCPGQAKRTMQEPVPHANENILFYGTPFAEHSKIRNRPPFPSLPFPLPTSLLSLFEVLPQAGKPFPIPHFEFRIPVPGRQNPQSSSPFCLRRWTTHLDSLNTRV